MDLLKSISSIHWTMLAAFIVLYGLLIAKTIFSALKLRSSFRHIFIKFVIRSSYFVLILIATLAPTFGGIKKEIKSTSKNIYIALDATESMNCKDLNPSRLEKSKQEIIKFVNSLNNDKVGLIIFNSKAYLHCPLTSDYNTFFTFLSTVKPGILRATYTDLSAPIDLAVQKFEHTKTSDAKVLVLISDGEDFGDNLSEVQEGLNKTQITLVTVGVGSSTGAKIPHGNGFRKDPTGEYAISYLQRNLLEDMASNNRGKYFEISDQETQTTQLIEFVNTLESTSSIQKSLVQVKGNKYIYFLFLAFVLIVIDVLINVKVIRL
jgi:Ca-activated chloride channel homolog